ncbi:MAG: HAD-IIIA family hydrolase [Woeseiaceae bacterium]|nr:HAD-IIIA family hydrolase [Woeseiaceae bacterium]
MSDRQCPADLKLIGFDVDGVFTDGRFYLSDDGVETKAFNTQDGFGIRSLLDAGIQVAVISGRSSAAVDKRMEELGVTHVFQDSKDKVAAFKSVVASLGIDASQTAFVGDDVPDLPLLQHAAFSIAVANATTRVKDQCDWVTTAAGGAGAVREACEYVLAHVKAESS